MAPTDGEGNSWARVDGKVVQIMKAGVITEEGKRYYKKQFDSYHEFFEGQVLELMAQGTSIKEIKEKHLLLYGTAKIAESWREEVKKECGENYIPGLLPENNPQMEEAHTLSKKGIDSIIGTKSNDLEDANLKNNVKNNSKSFYQGFKDFFKSIFS